MKIMKYWCKFLCIGLYLVVFASVICQAQRKEKEVVYRDYTHMEADLLDSLKQDDVKMLFKGVQALRQQAQQVKEKPTRLLGTSPGREEKTEITRYDREEERKRVDGQ